MALVDELGLQIPADFPVRNLSTAISANDEMFDSSYHYLLVGASAHQNITEAVQAAGLAEVSTILDLPCGHGRVTRILRAAYPAAKISVSDLNLDGVAFCAREFDAEPLTSDADFSKLDFGKTFDLIWVGSLITHLLEPAAADFIGFLARHLSPRGVAVATSHGQFSIDRLTTLGGQCYGLPHESAQDIIDAYKTHGFGYADYSRDDPYGQSYGISASAPAWVMTAIAKAGGRVLFYKSQAWDTHQDVTAFALIG